MAASEPVGDAGAATFALDTEVDAKITYSWLTDVLPSWSGLEQRVCVRAKPRRRFEFSSMMDEATQRLILATLARRGHDAPIFLLGMAHEALPLANATSSTLTLYSLSDCDWSEEGQRIIVRGRDGQTAETWIASIAGAVLTVNDDVTSVAGEGAIVMPALQVYLDPNQSLPRYQRALAQWQLVAHAQRFRYGLAGEPGEGASVTTYDSMPVWDRGIRISGMRAEQIMTGAELVDLGGSVSALGEQDQSQWMRGLMFDSARFAERQWLKLFLDTVKGRWKTFLLRTGRADLVAIGDASSGTLTIDTSAQSYINSWYPSLAHRRLAIVLSDKTVNYRTVESTAGGGATEDLVLDSPLAGTIARVEFLETVRLADDEVTIELGERGWAAQMSAMVVIDI